MRVGDLHRECYIVTRTMIIFMAQAIMPQFFAEKTVNAAICCCALLTLRRVTTRGRESREDMFILKAHFCDDVRRVIADSVIPLNPGIDPRCNVFNMDETAIYASTSAYTTVEEVGVRVVPALAAGSDSQRITMAVLENAWFDERVMHDWINHLFKPNVTSYSLLMVETLKTHKMDSVLDKLGAMGTSVHVEPPGCTGVAQPLDVGVMSPLKTHLILLF
ncbi:unnamed protein product [Phytophthora fragariaefolia]|uniref:Unnamed protein product n=1 Tax=Phytophthora fragariaefolia TaxID=1490495 RepID=A0A9W6TZ45_9STRA|nr:unnamed protein product [Phytophthora fragariaefolia]